MAGRPTGWTAWAVQPHSWGFSYEPGDLSPGGLPLRTRRLSCLSLHLAFPFPQQFHERRVRARLGALRADERQRFVARPFVLVHLIRHDDQAAAAHTVAAVDVD